MRFAVLGPVTVTGSGGTVEIGAYKRRLLLAVLLSRGGQGASADLLVDALWGDRAPSEERKRLAWHVNRLRQLLDDPARIAWRSHGYAIAVEPEELDAAEFERLYREGAAKATADPVLAGDLLGRAVGLWRGAAYGDLADCDAIRAEATRLEELRLSAIEARVDVDLALGRHRELVAELTTLVSEYRLHQKFRAQLMLALYRSGRQAEALEAYRDGRAVLAAEIGVDPGPELRRLERAILRDDPDLAPPEPSRAPVTVAAPRPAELPAGPAAFAGRSEEVARLRALLTAKDSPSAVVSAITGTGGVGKSALAIRVGRQIAEEFPDGQLYVNLHGATPEVASLKPDEALVRLLRSVGVDPPSDSAGVDELATRFRSAVADKRLLLVLDDARDAAQVRPLLPGGSGCAVVITSRSTLSSLDGADFCRLDVLSETDAVALLTRLAGEQRIGDDHDAASAIVSLCARMPLALCVAAARLNANPHWTLAALADRLAVERDRIGELDDGERAVRSSFMVSYRDLEAEAARLFRLLALHNGPDVSFPVVAALIDLSEDDAQALLNVLVGACLVDSHAPGRYRMHDLLRLFARERVASDEPQTERDEAARRMLHCYLATARNAHQAGKDAPDPSARLALPPQRLAHSGIAIDTKEAAQAWIGEELDNLLAVTRHASATPPNADAACAIAASAWPIIFGLGRWRKLHRMCEISMDAARLTSRREHEFFALVDMTQAELQLGLLDDAFDHGQRALEVAREHGDVMWETAALQKVGYILGRMERLDESAVYIRRCLDLSRQTGNLKDECVAFSYLGLIYQRLERFDDSVDAFQRSCQAAERSGDGYNKAAAKGNVGHALHAASRAAEAVPHFEAALRLDREESLSGSVLESDHNWGLGEVLYDLGRHAEARECWRKSAGILHGLDLISAEEKDAVEASEHPETPEVHKA
ncbi:MAG: BTAD domain-containing putative transcriptional regulator [Stackebrandtia sp.]